MIAPLLIPGKIGERNLFNCYEAAYGGLLQYLLGNQINLLKHISALDCFGIQKNESGSIFVSRVLNGIEYLIQHIPVIISKYHTISELKYSLKDGEPFIADIDEYYIPGYNNYKKKHSGHGSLALRVLNSEDLLVFEPFLVYEKIEGYNQQIMTIPNSFYPYGSIAFYRFKIDSAIDFVKEANEYFFDELYKYNSRLWKGNILEGNNGTLLSGLSAIDYVLEELSNINNVPNYAFTFYEWIYPLKWKKYHYSLSSNIKSSQLLDTMINEFHIIESNLLRLSVSKNERLHQSCLKRFQKIREIFEEYISIENVLLG